MSLTKYLTRYSTPSLLTEDGVKGLLAKALQNVQIFKPFNADVVFVTEAVQPCVRKSYFNRLYPQPPNISTVVGEFLHRLLQEQFKAQGYGVEVGLALDLGDFRLVGRADVVHDDENGNTHVVEIKTVGRLPQAPQKTHVLQLQVYMQLLNAGQGTILYIDRNKGLIRLFDVKPNPQALELAVANAKVLWQSLQDYVPPVAHRGAWCVFCPHRKRCWLVDRSVAV